MRYLQTVDCRIDLRTIKSTQRLKEANGQAQPRPPRICTAAVGRTAVLAGT
jgi:hypothetical protein